MSGIILKVENAGAEQLWNYIIAYRRMISKESRTSSGEMQHDSITLDVIQPMEQARTTIKQKET